VLLSAQSPALAGRVVLSLDGPWAVEEGIEADAIPASYSHTAPVPGLPHRAHHYETQDYVQSMIKYGVLPATERFEGPGRTRQERKYFWGV